MSNWLEGKIVERREWSPGLFSLRFEAAFGPFKAGQFIRVALDIEGERVGRPYSLVNAPQEPLLEIFFNVVSGGPLSPRLAELRAGDSLWLTDKPNGFLILDEIPAAPQLWLLATGTGLGPFLSILRTPDPWQRFEHVVLGHSVQRAADLAYREQIETMCAAHPDKLKYVPIVTRESAANTLSQRIPTLIESGQLEAHTGLSLAADTAHVMLCGNSTMITDVTETLAKRGMQRHRRREPGHITTEKYH